MALSPSCPCRRIFPHLALSTWFPTINCFRNNKREAQASCSFAKFSEEEQEPLSVDDVIDLPAKKQRSNLDFEEGLAVLSAEEDTEFDDFDEFFLAQYKTGPSIDHVLAEKVNASLCRKADKEMLGTLIKKFPLPGNIRNIKTPAMNKELRKLNRGPTQRDFRIAKLEKKNVISQRDHVADECVSTIFSEAQKGS